MAQFTNKASLAALKARNNDAEIQAGPSSKEGVFLFACGNEVGYFSKKAYEAFCDPSVPDSAFQYADVIDDNKVSWKMITLAGNDGPVSVTYTR